MLDFDLQLFGDDEPVTQAEEQVEEVEQAEKEKTFTQDEVNELIKSRLGREKTKFEKEIKDKLEQERKEAERLAKLSAEERANEVAQQKEYELEATKAELNRVLLENDTIARLNDEKLPATFKDLVISKDAETTNENIKVLKAEFDKAVQEQVEEKLKGKTPKIASTTLKVNNPWQKGQINLTEQGRIIRQNPELAIKLQREARGV